MKKGLKLLSLFISLSLLIFVSAGFAISSYAADGYNNEFSLTVGENIITNYTIDVDGYKSDGGATLEYTYNSAEGEEYIPVTETVNLSTVSESTYRFSIPQAAAQIAEPVTITVKDSNDSVIDTFERSALDYCNYYINMSDAQLASILKGKRLQTICKAIVAYAYSAQQQFSSYLELEGTVPINTSYYSDLDLPSADYTDTTGRVNTRGERVSFKSVSYFCTSTARLRFYLNTASATDSEIAAYPTSENIPSGVRVNKGYDEDKALYFIDISGLKPVDFDKLLTVNFCDASITMSVLQYAGMNIASSNPSVTSTVKNLSKSLIVYYNRAVDYFSNSTTVSFNGNGGTASTPQITVNAGDSVTLPNATRNGFTFSGWYTAATGGTRVGGNGDSYTPSDNIELFAQWSAYTVTYNANGGSVSPASDTVDSSGNVTLPTPTWAGHQFDGWYTAATGGTFVGNAGASYSPSSSTAIFAHWTAYTVTYNANGGSVSPSSATADNNGTVTLATPTRTGYTFNGWYTEATGGTFVGNAGASYTPSSSTTIFAHWTVNTHTVSWENSGSSTTVSRNDGNITISNGAEVEYNDVLRVDLTYSQSENRTFTVTSGGNAVTRYTDYACTNSTSSTDAGTYYFRMPDGDVTIQSYSEAGGGGGCVTEDTLVTLADGSQIRVDELTGDEKLLVWNLETGTYDTAYMTFIDSDAEDVYNVVYLYFSDGTETKLITEHAYFNIDEAKYVYINEYNYRDYIGDRFVKVDDIQNNEWKTVTLTDSRVVSETNTPYEPVTVKHLCYYVDGMLSIPGASTGFFNIFDVDVSVMKYDAEAMQRDIDTYGLYTYEDFEGVVSHDVFDAFSGQYLKVSMGKGLMTWDDIYRLVNRYEKYLNAYGNEQ